MAIPKKIKIGNAEYRVNEVFPDEMRRENLWGNIDHGVLEIKIRRDLKPIVKRETLWHEILHCLDGAGIRKFKEGELDVLAQFIVQVLTDNGKI